MTTRIFEFTINPEYLCNVPVTYGFPSDDGRPCSISGQVDHPSFAELREHLGARGFIKIQRGWWNGDMVEKPFTLNGREFNVGERFPCAGALGISFSVDSNSEL